MSKAKQERQVKLTRKQELILLFAEGGWIGLSALKELIEIEKQEAKEDAKKERRLLALENERRIRKHKDSLWKEGIKTAKMDKKPAIYALLKEVSNVIIDGEKLYIIFDNNFSFAVSRLNSFEYCNYTKTLIKNIYGFDYEVEILGESEFNELEGIDDIR